ncbi:hypothetical protein R3P38DRAFT_2786916 [Favolaschia claudopus]|uniref:Uncharacterized protein n=1 Tax=Favolaschia claudopus TaxID=2862362 RepID=A0AAW0AS96_9AGAR
MAILTGPGAIADADFVEQQPSEPTFTFGNEAQPMDIDPPTVFAQPAPLIRQPMQQSLLPGAAPAPAGTSKKPLETPAQCVHITNATGVTNVEAREGHRFDSIRDYETEDGGGVTLNAERRVGDIGQASSERRANTQKELEQRKKAGAKRYEEAAKRRRGEWKRRRGAGKRRVEAGRRRGVAGRRQTWVPQCRVGYLKRGGRQISRSEVSAMEADDSSTQDEDDSSSSSCAPAVSAGGSGERRRGSGEREQELASGARGNSERRWWSRRPEAGQRQTQVPRCDTAWGAKEGGAAADRDGTAWLNPKDRRRKWDRPLSSRDEDEEDEDSSSSSRA